MGVGHGRRVNAVADVQDVSSKYRIDPLKSIVPATFFLPSFSLRTPSTISLLRSNKGHYRWITISNNRFNVISTINTYIPSNASFRPLNTRTIQTNSSKTIIRRSSVHVTISIYASSQQLPSHVRPSPTSEHTTRPTTPTTPT
jgi:hypothetical protein